MNGNKLDAEAFISRQVDELERQLRRLGAHQDDIDRCRTLGDLLSLKRRTIGQCMSAPSGR